MQTTPNANRIHIAFFGKTNSGKSSLINAIAGHEVSIVSPISGTTTDPIQKAIEIHPIGACTLIDTAGFGDHSPLGTERLKRTEAIIQKTDIAVLLFCEEDTEEEKKWMNLLQQRNIPILPVINKADIIDSEKLKNKIKQDLNLDPVILSTWKKQNFQEFFDRLSKTAIQLSEETSICMHLVNQNDHVLLVMPQDIQAPKGRLILPQVQTIRDLLENRCVVTCVTLEQLPHALDSLKHPPNLIITDSQLFFDVYRQKPEQSNLTSFSVLFSKYKGDIEVFLKGAEILDVLSKNAKILIAEACSHKPLQEDIGRVKLPRLLRKKFGETLRIDICSGNDFPEYLTDYDLIIHCGACMFNRNHVLSRIALAKEQNIPITNYGIAIAKLNGILDKVIY